MQPIKKVEFRTSFCPVQGFHCYCTADNMRRDECFNNKCPLFSEFSPKSRNFDAWIDKDNSKERAVDIIPDIVDTYEFYSDAMITSVMTEKMSQLRDTARKCPYHVAHSKLGLMWHKMRTAKAK